MSFSLGVYVGSAMAAFLDDIRTDVDDVEAWEKLARVSECYERLSRSKLPGFDAGFERGYSTGLREHEFEMSDPNAPSP